MGCLKSHAYDQLLLLCFQPWLFILIFSCLRAGHTADSSDCYFRKIGRTCGVSSSISGLCQEYHHSLLHYEEGEFVWYEKDEYKKGVKAEDKTGQPSVSYYQVTNWNLFCWLFTIKYRCKKGRSQQTHNQGLRQLLTQLTVSLLLCRHGSITN